MSEGARPRWRWALLALAPLLVVLAFRLAGPEDIDDNDQAKQALYALDVYENHNWILPQERGVLPATKPPLYAWLVTAAFSASGGPSELACRIPSALASLLLVLVTFQLGSERFGPRAGVLAAWILCSSHVFVTLSTHVRPDAVLALLVACALFALHRAELGRPRGAAPLFWLSLALSALAKGPVGWLVAGGAAAAVCVPAEGRARVLPVLRSPWAWSLLLPLVWLALAYSVGGSPYLTETLLPETVDRVLASGTRSGKSAPFGYLILHFIAKGVPWSAFALMAAASAATRAGRQRRPSLLLPVGGAIAALLLLNLSKGQRPDYLLPLLPPASLAAAAVLAEGAAWTRFVWRLELWVLGAAAALAGGLASAALGPGASWAALLGARWSAVLLLAGAVLLASAWRAGRRGGELAFGAALAALLALHAAYNGALAPPARSGRAPQVRAFAERARDAAQPGDRLDILAGVPNSLFFLLRHNEPALTLGDLETYAPWAARGGRALLVSNAQSEQALAQRWPGRFCPLLRQPLAEVGGGFVLLEDRGETGCGAGAQS